MAEFGMRGSACKNWRSWKAFSRSEFKSLVGFLVFTLR
ncbi:unnamed protein product, partial [Brassica oleracea var. botrytis]